LLKTIKVEKLTFCKHREEEESGRENGLGIHIEGVKRRPEDYLDSDSRQDFFLF